MGDSTKTQGFCAQSEERWRGLECLLVEEKIKDRFMTRQCF